MSTRLLNWVVEEIGHTQLLAPDHDQIAQNLAVLQITDPGACSRQIENQRYPMSCKPGFGPQSGRPLGLGLNEVSIFTPNCILLCAFWIDILSTLLKRDVHLAPVRYSQNQCIKLAT